MIRQGWGEMEAKKLTEAWRRRCQLWRVEELERDSPSICTWTAAMGCGGLAGIGRVRGGESSMQNSEWRVVSGKCRAGRENFVAVRRERRKGEGGRVI